MTSRTDVDRKLHPRIISAAAIASGLAAEVSVAAPGDLDPQFGDVGRVVLPASINGAIWALEGDGSDAFDFAGGDTYCYYYDDYCDQAGFVGSFTGASNQAVLNALPDLATTNVQDLARQADGKLVGIGLTSSGSTPSLTLFRLLGNRSPDAAFGSGGLVQLKGTVRAAGHSVLLDPDGRIVAAGVADGRAVVLRFLPTGEADPSFGASGRYDGPIVAFGSEVAKIVRSPGGGYRLMTVEAAGCRVTALTNGGAEDGAFGQAGSATPGADAGGRFQCEDIAAQPDGKLLVVGYTPTRSLAVRVAANGSPDPSFAPSALEQLVANARTVALAPDGSVYVGGMEPSGLAGSAVVRLLADGRTDTRFGVDGRTIVDINTPWGYFSSAETLRVLRDGSVLAGGLYWREGKPRPYAAKLLASGGGPGVLGVKKLAVLVDEADGQAQVTVRRTGGTVGAVSVAYSTTSVTATAGQDFTPVSGRFDWPAGDDGERTIRIPIASGDDPNEGEELFTVSLSDPGGGAGLGAGLAGVTIAGFGYPSGILNIYATTPIASEGAGSASFVVRRTAYWQGPASVTVTPVSGTATAGSDFSMAPVTLTWAANDRSERVITVQLISDGQREGDESFSLSLSSPSAGAFLGSSSSATVIIQDAPTKSTSSGGGGGGGGGGEGPVGVGLLGLLALGRRWLRRGGGQPAG